MSRSRAPLALGLAAAGGIGYYLYGAGGNAKVAEKNFEADAHKASAKIRSELPGRGQQAQKEAEAYGQQAGAKFDSAVAKSQAELQKAESQAKAYAKDAEAYAKDTKAAALKKVDEFDKKVEQEASKAKSGVSSWFGGK
ncbi:hypothetical protein N0V82_006858 [Gnomoniopsis sp. IMI 355080]|nr:hypothetical protein N0V82_006858 [Gnomoniopsis sp. IMI 355080]